VQSSDNFVLFAGRGWRILAPAESGLRRRPTVVVTGSRIVAGRFFVACCAGRRVGGRNVNGCRARSVS
jgi:hypothetical protein